MREQLFEISANFYMLLLNFYNSLNTFHLCLVIKEEVNINLIQYLFITFNQNISNYLLSSSEHKMQIPQQILQYNKDKKQDGTESESSFNKKSDKIKVKNQLHSLQLTSRDKILNYLKFFTNTNNQNSSESYLAKNPIYAADMQVNNFLITSLIEKLQKQLQENKGKNKEVLLDFQTVKLIQNCQKSTHQQLQRTLLASKRFKKQKTFSSEILIHEIESSKHTQITTLEIQLLWYKTRITILNQVDKAPQKLAINNSCSGSFGFVYLFKVQDRQFALKSIPFHKNIIEQDNETLNIKNPHDNYHAKIQAIQQFFFLLLFSQLQIGPQVRTIEGFDIVIYEDSIEFATQICSSTQTTKERLVQLKESLFQMHILQVVHRDIKPSNIMFSPTFNKNVFIDFGVTQVLKEKLGEMTVTQFVGTASYCSNEVFLLLSQRGMAVDLYYNDVFGLRKMLAQVSGQIIHSSVQNSDATKNETPHIHPMDRNQYFAFQIINLKFLMHQENYEMFDTQWRYLSTKYHEQTQEWEMKILSFFKELRPNEYLREFYWKQLSQKTRDRPQFKELGQIFQNQGCEMLYYLSADIQKKQLYAFHSHFYKIIEIDYGNSTPEEKQILMSLMDEKSIKQSIEILFKNASNNLEENSDIQKLCLIVAHYCSVSSNLYRISIEQKIRICQQTLSLIQQHDSSYFNNLRLTFKCPNQALNTINIFYHYFILRVFRKILYKFKFRSMFNTFSSLFLLGLSTKNNMGTKYLLDQLIKQYDQDENNSELISKSKDYDDQIRMEKILLFWEFKVALLLFNDVFYNRNQTKSLIQHDEKEIERMGLTTLNLMQAKEEQDNEFFKLNLKFFEILQMKFQQLNQTVWNQMCQILRSPAVQHLASSSQIILKWKKLMWITLCIFFMASRGKNSTKLRNNIQKQIISKYNLNQTIFPCMVHFFFDNVYKTKIRAHNVLKIIDKIVGSKQISLRFKLEMRFSNALEKKDFQELKQLCSFIQRQIDYSSISSENIEFLNKILLIIYEFLVLYLKQMPNINKELVLLIKLCYEVIKLGMEVGMNYFQQKRCSSKLLLFLKSKNDSNQELGVIDIIEEIADRKLVKSFAVGLMSTGQTYQKITNIIYNESSNQQKKGIKKLDEKYCLFIAKLMKDLLVIDYSSVLINLISEDQNFKKEIKTSRTTCLNIAYLFLDQRKNRQQVMLSHQIIEDLFGEISINRLNSSSESQNFPTLQIVFDYIQVKLLKTNYDPYWCNQLIQFYKIYQNQDYFQIILFQDSLIKFLFNSYIYTQKSYLEIQSFLQNITQIIRKTITTKIIHSVKKIFESLFSCLCKNCFPRQPPSSWDPNKFIKYLFSTLKLEKANQNPYMSLIYYYSMRNKFISFQIGQKFIKFMLISLKHLSRQIKEFIISKIYYFAFSKARFQKNTLLLNEKSLKSFQQQKIERIPQYKMNDKDQRKLIYFYCQFMKHQSECADLIEDLIEKRLIKEYYIKGYKYPGFIKELLVKKLRRYHEVRQNYKQVQQITELNKSHNFEQRFSLMN